MMDVNAVSDAADEGRRTALRSFLRARRRRIAPALVGLPAGASRRATGLRREDVAEIAGVSLGWYARFELGALASVSDRLIDAVARALRLDEAERDYVRALARPSSAQPEPAYDHVPENLRFVVESFTAGPAVILGSRLDPLVVNDIARRIQPGFDNVGLRSNLLWLAFVDPTFSSKLVDPEKSRREIVAMLRYSYASHVGERAYEELIASISEHSADFVSAWDAFEVKVSGSEEVRLSVDGEPVAFSPIFLTPTAAPGKFVVFLRPNDPARFRELIARVPST